jgi:hypothetical protein
VYNSHQAEFILEVKVSNRMKLYVFDSERAYGLTDASDASSRLPNEFGDWKFWKHLDMESEEFGRIDVNSRDCLADIEKQGYHLIIKKEVPTAG